VTHGKTIEHAGTPQVNIAILQANFFADIDIAVDFKRRGLGLIENLQFLNSDFDLAGSKTGVFHPLASRTDSTLGTDHPFTPQGAGDFVNLGVFFRIEHKLHQPGSVA